MLNHIMIGSNDIERSKAFYTAVLGVLGAGEPMAHVNDTGQTRLFYIHNGTTFSISEPINGEPCLPSNGFTIGFKCDSLEQIKREAARAALTRNHGRRMAACRELDISKDTLRRLLSHTAGLTVSGFRGYAQGEAVPTILQVLDGLSRDQILALRSVSAVLPFRVNEYVVDELIDWSNVPDDRTGFSRGRCVRTARPDRSVRQVSVRSR